MEKTDINSAELIDARLTMKNWMNSFLGKTREEVEAVFGKDKLEEEDWIQDGEEGVILEYECHDYSLQFYVFDGEIVTSSFMTFSN
ncbi:MAG: hypothetical protein ACYTFY_22830 [Planctomycetota bacterium]|jgi:hypothetical protein